MRRIKLAIALCLFALLVVFMALNTQSVSVNFIGVKLEAPAAVVVLFSAATGVMLWPLLRTVFQRSR